MAEKRAQRRLAAILAADVVGYSRLMEHDEAGTLAALKARRRDLLVPVVVQHNGRVVNFTGDGVLVEFASAVDAVQCAVELQKGFTAANEGIPEALHIVLRIGINLGDVIVEGSDIFGDGVNIAARLEALAEPGGIYVSAIVHDQVTGKLSLAFGDLGEHTLKNIVKPVRVYSVETDGADKSTARPKLASLGTSVPSKLMAVPTMGSIAVLPFANLDADAVRPDTAPHRDRKTVIAVLPFENLSGDPGQQYFSDGMTEDITDRLSKYRFVSVIGRYSSFAMRGRDTEMREIRDKLSADYVLTGNIRKSETRIRVAARLIDARTENVMWADHYDRPLQDIFAVQDEVASIIASTLMGRVEIDFGSRSLAASPASISSYEHVLQGMWHFNKLTREAITNAASCFEKAIASYPQNGEAHRWLSACHISSWLFDFSPTDMSNCLREAVRAVELDPASARCHTALGLCKLWLNGVEAAAPSYQKAFTLNPGDPNVLVELGLLNAYAGDLSKSRKFFDQALQLLPLPPLWFAVFRGVAEFSEGRYAQALPSFMALPEATAWDTMYAMACLGHLGNQEQAAACRARIQAAGRTWDLLKAAKAEPFLDPEPRKRLIEGVEKALAL